MDFYCVVVIGNRAPEEDADMGTEVDMGGGVDVALGSEQAGERDSQPTRRPGVNSGA